MAQAKLENNVLTLKVKKSPYLIRILLFVFSFLFFVAPFLGMLISIQLGNKFHIGFVIGIIVFGLLGFYMLRISLWNSFGKETIVFHKSEIIYEADYKWFKDGKKASKINPPYFSIIPIGYKEDNIGALFICDENENEFIESVVKIPIEQLEGLIDTLYKEFN